MGFEIGNHTWTHAGFNTPRMAARFAGELALVENELAAVGVPKPISFAWSGNAFGPDCLAVLEKAGYRLARRGMQPEEPYGSLALGPLFDPHRHHPLLVPSAGDAYPDWTLEHFKQVVDRATGGRAAVLQFHGVPDTTHPSVNTPWSAFAPAWLTWSRAVSMLSLCAIFCLTCRRRLWKTTPWRALSIRRVRTRHPTCRPRRSRPLKPSIFGCPTWSATITTPSRKRAALLACLKKP